MNITREEWLECPATIEGMAAALAWADHSGRTISEWRIHPQDRAAIMDGPRQFFTWRAREDGSPEPSALGILTIDDVLRPVGEARGLIYSITVEAPAPAR